MDGDLAADGHVLELSNAALHEHLCPRHHNHRCPTHHPAPLTTAPRLSGSAADATPPL
jgi:hypothetical protein